MGRDRTPYTLQPCTTCSDAGADDAADLTADVFLVAWRRPAEIPVDGPLLWLYAAWRTGVLANHRRSTRRRTALT